MSIFKNLDLSATIRPLAIGAVCRNLKNDKTLIYTLSIASISVKLFMLFNEK